jgi:hypothetical protein
MARNVKHPGLSRRSRKLGVSVGHMHFILEGVRKNDDLLARYNALVAEEEKIASMSEEFALVESTLTRAAELLESVDESDPTGEANKAIAAQYNGLVTAELRDAIARLGSRLPLGTTMRFVELFRQEQVDFLFNIHRKPGHSNVIVIGQPPAPAVPAVQSR